MICLGLVASVFWALLYFLDQFLRLVTAAVDLVVFVGDALVRATVFMILVAQRRCDGSGVMAFRQALLFKWLGQVAVGGNPAVVAPLFGC